MTPAETPASTENPATPEIVLPVPDGASTRLQLIKAVIMVAALVGAIADAVDAYTPIPDPVLAIVVTAIVAASAWRAATDYFRNRDTIDPPSPDPKVIPLPFGAVLTIRKKRFD